MIVEIRKWEITSKYSKSNVFQFRIFFRFPILVLYLSAKTVGKYILSFVWCSLKQNTKFDDIHIKYNMAPCETAGLRAEPSLFQTGYPCNAGLVALDKENQ